MENYYEHNKNPEFKKELQFKRKRTIVGGSLLIAAILSYYMYIYLKTIFHTEIVLIAIFIILPGAPLVGLLAITIRLLNAVKSGETRWLKLFKQIFRASGYVSNSYCDNWIYNTQNPYDPAYQQQLYTDKEQEEFSEEYRTNPW